MLLYELINNPLLSINKLQKRLTEHGLDTSYHLTKKAYNELKINNYLRENRKIVDIVFQQIEGKNNKNAGLREMTDVEGNYMPRSLGLLTQHVFFMDIRSDDGVKKFARICDEHPYTHYRAVCVGNGVNLYAIFNIPPETLDYMAEFYEQVNIMVEGSQLEILNQDKRLQMDLNMKNWSISERNWIIPEPNFETSMNKFWDQLEVPDSLQREKEKNHLDELDAEDLLLIRELTINALVKATDLALVYRKDISTISRRLQKINKNIMGKPTLLYNRSKFDVTTPQLILGRAPNAQILNKLYHMLGTQAMPFMSTMVSEGLKFRIVIYAPPNLAAEIAYFVWSKTSNTKVMTFSISHDRSWRYYFYPNNYDEKTRYWRTSRAYVLDNIIKIMK